MHSLILKTFEPSMRRHFITSSKSMTIHDLSFLKELYINSKFDLMTVGDISAQVAKLLASNNILDDLTIEKLRLSGFIHKNKSEMTSFGEQYTESIFSSCDLKPKSIERKSWTGINIVIISYQLGDQHHSSVGIEIQKSLWKINIKSSIQIIDQRPTASMFYGAGVLLVGDKKIDNKYLNALPVFVKQVVA